VSHTGGELNIVSEDPTDLAIETVARPGAGVLLVVRRYAMIQPAEGIAYRSLSPPPLVEFAVAYRRDDPSPTLAHLLRVVDDLAPDDSGTAPENGELI
jgi:hypothetical protein